MAPASGGRKGTSCGGLSYWPGALQCCAGGGGQGQGTWDRDRDKGQGIVDFLTSGQGVMVSGAPFSDNV